MSSFIPLVKRGWACRAVVKAPWEELRLGVANLGSTHGGAEWKKKRLKILTRKILERKNLRKKSKMENQKKKLESRIFFEKKETGNLQEKKNLQWKIFAKKALS